MNKKLQLKKQHDTDAANFNAEDAELVEAVNMCT